MYFRLIIDVTMIQNVFWQQMTNERKEKKQKKISKTQKKRKHVDDKIQPGNSKLKIRTAAVAVIIRRFYMRMLSPLDKINKLILNRLCILKSLTNRQIMRRLAHHENYLN